MMSSTLPGPPLAELVWRVPSIVQIFVKKAATDAPPRGLIAHAQSVRRNQAQQMLQQ
jgi:hypothetical protein